MEVCMMALPMPSSEKEMYISQSWLSFVGIKLLQAASDSRAVFETLMANVTWTDNPNRHGKLSVSEDGKSLVYTADLRQGLAVVIR